MQIKNIINLSKVFIRENENKLKFIDFRNRRIEKKSGMFWILLIIFLAVSYCGQAVVKYFVKTGKPEIFLNGYFSILQILIIMQIIMICINIFYFSKDMEEILPLPFKPIEILISKFNTILFIVYGTELLIGFIPFVTYGIYTDMGLLFYINLFFSLILFPIFSVLMISIIMMFLMKTINLFKNKDVMQVIISFILILAFMLFINVSFRYVFNNENIFENKEQSQMVLDNINEKIISINKYFIVINPITKLLQENNIFKILFLFIKILFINIITFSVFYILGNKLYLRQLLKNSYYIKNNYNKELNYNKKFKRRQIGFSYIKKEFKNLFKNPTFFMQYIYPTVIWTAIISFLLIVFTPEITKAMQLEQYKEMAEKIKFNFEAICLIIGGVQITGLFNYTAITSFSREGQDAYVIKYLPIDLYKQFIYKNIPQIIINMISTIVILSVIHISIPAIELKYLFVIFILSLLLTIINSFISTIIDLLNPKLNWNGEYEILENNTNKLFQYVLIILNVLFLYYFDKLLLKHNLDKSLILFGAVLFIMFIIINVLINKFKDKLFKKIN